MAFGGKLIIVSGLMPGGKVKIFAPAVLWGIVILTVSSIPYLSPPSLGFSFEDKIAHFGEYGVLGILLAYGFSRQGWGWKKVFLVSAVFSGVFGILDELHQLLIPGRQMDALDMTADLTGAFSAAGIYLIVLWKRRKIHM